jgi:hypothetical protein
MLFGSVHELSECYWSLSTDYLPTVNLPCRRWWGDDGGGCGVTAAPGSGLAVAPRIELGFGVSGVGFITDDLEEVRAGGGGRWRHLGR